MGLAKESITSSIKNSRTVSGTPGASVDNISTDGHRRHRARSKTHLPMRMTHQHIYPLLPAIHVTVRCPKSVLLLRGGGRK